MKSRKVAGLAGAIAAALLLAACGSSSSSKPAGGGGGATSAAAPTTASGTATTAAGGGDSSASAAIAAAAANFKAHTVLPTTMPAGFTALPSKPPTKDANGKPYLVVFLQCEQNQCAYQGDGLEAAAKAVGWQFKRLNFQQANPATEVAAMKSALQFNNTGDHLVGVYLSGPAESTYASVLPQYAAAGAYIGSSYADTAPTGAGTMPTYGYQPDSEVLGTLLADAQITNSNGAPSKSIIVTVSQYPVFGPLVTAYKTELAKVCPACTTVTADATLAQLAGNQLNSVVVSTAQRNQDAKYIVSVNGSFIASLPTALKSANLDGKFQIISGEGISLDQQNVLNGSALYTTNSPFGFGGFQDMDIALRTVMKLPIPDVDHEVPTFLLTKDNIGTPQDSYNVPSDYQAQFAKLWLVG